MAILETERLTRRFGQLTAVDGLSIEVQTGEVFGLLGPNGAGKTTVLKMLTTLLPPTSGTARVAGFDIVRRAGEVRRVIGYVPQMLSADGTLTGYENLLIFAKLYDLPRANRDERVRDALAFMGLTDSSDKLVREYSGGMIRRLEIAQSMLHAPRVLFLDEPTVGLDPVARKAVWERIEELRREPRGAPPSRDPIPRPPGTCGAGPVGKVPGVSGSGSEGYGTTILLTTHYMEEAESLCDRVAIMHLGKVAATGTPEELKLAIGGNGATMDDVFAHYTGAELESGGNYRETFRTRRTARRLG